MFKVILLLFFLIKSLFAEDILIGKYDRIDLPNFNLKNLRAKIDTGAKTSSLHCRYIEQVDKNTVIFKVLDKSHRKYKEKKFSMPIKRIALVKSSNGISEKRYVILTKVIIFDKSYDVEFTLRNRKAMSYPILLGREFLKKGFIVDVRKEDISYSRNKKK